MIAIHTLSVALAARVWPARVAQPGMCSKISCLTMIIACLFLSVSAEPSKSLFAGWAATRGVASQAHGCMRSYKDTRQNRSSSDLDL